VGNVKQLTMKILALLLNVVLAFHVAVARHSFQAGSRRSLLIKPTTTTRQQNNNEDDYLSLLWSKIPRGGASQLIPAPSDFAKAIGLLAAGDGLLATLTPEMVGKLVNVDVQKGSVNHFFVEGGIGAASVSMAVTLYLALTGITEVDRAIAYGSMSLLLVYLKCWYMGGMAKNMGANTLAVGIAAFCVGAGAGYMLQSGNALAVAKIISSAVVIWSLLHYLFPGLLKLTFGIDMEEQGSVVPKK
jgi:hypothetical protein